MSDSDSSSLSSAPPTDDEKPLAPIFAKMAKGKKAAPRKKKAPVTPPTPPSPPRPKRSPSPPHQDSLADNPDVAFLVMFRSRFSHAFPPKLPHLGPQDIEKGVAESPPSPQVEELMCAMLALVLNRKKPVERGHHGRAMEEALSTQKHQWPLSWNRVNPLAGSRTFPDMTPAERLNLLRTLAIWSLTSSDVVSQTIKDSYKINRREDDINQPLSVQHWGYDGDKRKYYLIEGQDDTSFRVYREANRSSQNPQWWSVAETIDEVNALAEKLETKDTTQAARRLADKVRAAVPRFEASEEKRRRREYRQLRKAQFTKPEPGFSLYEGRTRGKRIRYTYSDNEDESDATGSRRSTRHSGNNTPAESGPVVTASGRQVRPARTGIYGESLLSGQAETPDYAASETSRTSGGRATRNSTRISPLNEDRKRKSRGYNSFDEDSDEEDAPSSGNEWDGGDDDENEEDNVDMADGEDEDEMDLDQQEEPKSLIVKLKFKKRTQEPVKTENAPIEEKPPPATDPARVSMARQELENLSTQDEPVKTQLAEHHPKPMNVMDYEMPTPATYHAHPPPAPLPAVSIPDQQQVNGTS
ncbi:hypothetical protein D6D19_08311 [Aureobasidium pullulans]|uniref:WHIM1 domain-containing protein n=1 Tax=Aureobasidium pullulans TaxID=5580 RepID=A0A4S8ZT77_AURPU|nr:hypothetical protein D6D19_08311 [Aureobasidium pullulans]